MIALLIHALISAIHFDHGPHGFVFWIWPPHMSVGAGIVQGHLITWWETQPS